MIRTSTIFAFVTALGTIATPVFAQVANAPEKGRGFGMAAAAVLVAGVIVASLKGAGRGHQD